MCGIALVCSSKDGNFNTTAAPSVGRTDLELPALRGLIASLRARGPDFLGTREVAVSFGIYRLHFFASLLQLRGSEPRTAPCTSIDGHVLCFNGEVFGGLPIAPGENDGACLMAALMAASALKSPAAASGPSTDLSSVPQVLSSLRGPWALLFWEPAAQRLWLGRDVLGRRSLLVHYPDGQDPRLLISSVSQLPPDPSAAAPEASAGSAVLAATTAPLPARVPREELALDGGGNDGAGHVGSNGGGDGHDSEDSEPAGSDGYWTELPPGLYSISFAPAPEPPKPLAAAAEASAEGLESGPGLPPTAVPELQSDSSALAAAARSETVCQGAGHVGPGPGGGAAEAGEGGVGGFLFRRVTLGGGGGELRLERHGWRDPLLRQLEDYRRPEAGGEKRAALDSEAEAKLQAGDEGNATAGPARGCAPTERGPAGAAAASGAEGAAATGEGELPSLPPMPPASSCALLMRLGGSCPPAPLSPAEALAHALLRALLAAMRVRCGCIETRSPHPAAAYAAAAAAAAADSACGGSGSSPQPSWRRSDPLDFRLDTAEPVQQPQLCGVDTASTAPVVSSGTCTRAIAGRTAAAAAPVMILFSGGVDSVLLAALAHRVLPPGVPIDLSNVCFAGSGGGSGAPSPDREAARDALAELCVACPSREWRLVEVDASLRDLDRHRSRLLALLRPAHTVMDLNIGAALWLATAGQGTLRRPAPTSAIVFAAAGEAAADDAVTAAATAAASGRGGVAASSSAAGADAAGAGGGSFYGSAARVVLLGHGADEQCGGYGRHRTRFRSGGWADLASELEVDVRRLWLRNLGRDDRLVADWGREGRHPFLDEEVVRLLLGARLDSILDPHLPPGRGDKLVLRLALQLLGLPRAAGRVKRAIQFGSRIGKLANRRDFGSNRAANRNNAGGVALQDVKAAAASAAASAWIKPAKGS